MNDLTVLFYTCNCIPDKFMEAVKKQLLIAIGDLPLISVSHKPMDFGENIVVDLERSHFNIYRQALIGAKSAKTKYIALCEDDELYSPAHFEYRPRKKPFAYNLSYWGIYTWKEEPLYEFKGRKNLGNLICEREAFIEAMEERFARHAADNPDDNRLKDVWAEPGKYEKYLGVTVRETEDFYTRPPNIKFSHQTELSFAGLGTRKRSGDIQAIEIPYWGRAEDVRRHYDNLLHSQ